MNIVKFDTLSSTNTEALNGDWPAGTIIVAEHQTCGRGQRGNTWNAPPSQNLTFSVVLCPDIPLSESFYLSMSASVAVTELLRSYGLSASIKWPNDIYVGDLKIAGILIENSLSSETVIRKSVIGIGLNVGQTMFPENIPNPTSMALCGCDVCKEDVLKRFTEIFPQCLYAGDIYENYMPLLWRSKGLYPYRDANGEFLAEIADIDRHVGRILLKKEDGTIQSYYFKEVQALLK